MSKITLEEADKQALEMKQRLGIFSGCYSMRIGKCDPDVLQKSLSELQSRIDKRQVFFYSDHVDGEAPTFSNIMGIICGCRIVDENLLSIMIEWVGKGYARTANAGKTADYILKKGYVDLTVCVDETLSEDNEVDSITIKYFYSEDAEPRPHVWHETPALIIPCPECGED